ncbi:MAG: NPCBM/NEW2 domain-containing protein, partial [Fimbriimonas sp.]|nr:NPCBM/NEW2 domain-containing protein [Fimbriimonas sp.]
MTVALLVAVIAGSQLMSKAEYLSDIPDRLVHVEQGWGELGFDVCAHAPGQMPLKLQIGSKVFTKGLGNHAPGRIVVDLEGRYTGFDAEVGVEKQDSTEGSVVFSVLVDGKKRFDSGVMRQTSDPKPVHVPLFGAQELELVAGDAGDGIICDCANWLDARLTLSSKAVPTRRSPFDVAPFGQVTTWNPQRKKGTEASRIGEFPADEVFLDHPMTQLKGGGYRLPSNGCIGLLWLERRKPKSLQLAFEGASPDLAGIHVEAWAGTAPFQGDWKPLPGHLVAGKRTLTYAVEAGVGPDFLDGFRKVRWILVPRSKTPIRVTKLGATVDCRTKNVSVVLEARANTHGLTTVRPFSCSLNGGESVEWSMDRVTRIDVSYPAGPGLTDGPGQPALRLAMPNGGTTIRLADILRGEGVYLRDVGVLVHSLKSGKTILEVEKSVEQKRTVLERVRQMPDQTLKRAMDRTYREVHFGSPTLLSLGENNWKWLVGSDGSVVWLPAPEPPEVQLPFENRRCSMAVRYNGMILNPAKRLNLPAKMERWMPVRELVGDRGLKLTTFVAPAKENKSVFLAEIEAPDSLDGNLDLSFLSDRNRNAEAKVVLDGGLAWVIDGDRLLARIDLSDAGSSPVIDQGRTSIKLKAGGHVRVLIPGWVANVGDSAFADTDSKGLATGFVAYWRHWDSQGMQFSIPDPFLSDLIRSSMVRCQVDARAQGNRIAPWIAEIHYGPLESEANTIIRGMGLMGKQEFVERSLDYFIHLYNPAGYLTTGYTVVGTGWHLWTLGEAFALFRDETWLKGHADEVARVCRWVMAQRRKTMKLDASGNRPPQYGLMTPGVIADWNAYQYYFYSNGTYCAGL